MHTNTPRLEGIQRTVPAGKHLFQVGDPATHAFYIHQGHVRIQGDSWVGLHRGDGAHQTDRLLDIAGPQDFLGIHAHKHPHTATTATDTKVTIIQREHLTRPENVTHVLEYVARANVRNELRLQQNDLPVAMRICEALHDLGKRFGNPSDNNGVSFTLPLTHGDIADLVNSSRVTVTKFMSEFAREGILDGSRGHYVLNAEAAEAYIANLIFST